MNKVGDGKLSRNLSRSGHRQTSSSRKKKMKKTMKKMKKMKMKVVEAVAGA